MLNIQIRHMLQSSVTKIIILCLWSHRLTEEASCQGIFTKGKNQYGRPLCKNQFRSAHFHTETIIFYKTIYCNKEVNCTEHFPSVRIPCPCVALPKEGPYETPIFRAGLPILVNTQLGSKYLAENPVAYFMSSITEEAKV